jgi:methionyl aminopeptidase
MTFVSSVEVSGRKIGHIKLHREEDFAGMRRAGRLAAEALDLLTEYVKPGVTTEALDKLIFDFAMEHNAYPAPLDYRGYRKSICTSINHVVCHGIPERKPLREGDILNIDVTLILDGWHGDSSRMYLVGEVPRRAQRLVDVTYEARDSRRAPGRNNGRHWRRDPRICRGRALLRRAGFLRPWSRPPFSR